MNQYLPWISDDALTNAVLNVYKSMESALSDTTMDDLQSQIIDPFALVFETLATDLDVEQWLKAEAQRQAQKSWMNQVGYFHQEVLGAVNGWVDLGTGHESELDLMRADGRVYAEIKNKHNTLNSSSRTQARQKLGNVTQGKPDVTGYLVQIVRKRLYPYNEPWKVSGFETGDNIRLISGELFYELVTGSPTALADLFQVIPTIMSGIVQREGRLSAGRSTAIDDLLSVAASSQEDEFLRYFLRYAYRNA